MNTTREFNPDADPETTCCDGYVFYYIAAGDIWANVRGAANGTTASASADFLEVLIGSDDENNKWRKITRSIMGFDTSVLPDDCVIKSAQIKLCGTGGGHDDLGIGFDVNIYSATPATDTNVVVGDYSCLGAVPYCDTPIAFTAWDLNSWNTFILNTVGVAAISKAGITIFGFRNGNYDAVNIEPTWAATDTSYITAYSADDSSGQSPTLTIVYSTLGTSKTEITVLEALRNIEMSAGGRVYVDEQGRLAYENRYARNP